jgi:hypothetical protein
MYARKPHSPLIRLIRLIALLNCLSVNLQQSHTLTQFVKQTNNAIDWLWGSLEGGLQGGVARFTSEQRMLTKWTAVDQSCGTSDRASTIAVVDDDDTVERHDEKAKKNRIRIGPLRVTPDVLVTT